MSEVPRLHDELTHHCHILVLEDVAVMHEGADRVRVIEKTLDDADRLVGADQCHIIPAAFVRRQGAPLRDRIWNESPCTWNGWA